MNNFSLFSPFQISRPGTQPLFFHRSACTRPREAPWPQRARLGRRPPHCSALGFSRHQAPEKSCRPTQHRLPVLPEQLSPSGTADLEASTSAVPGPSAPTGPQQGWCGTQVTLTPPSAHSRSTVHSFAQHPCGLLLQQVGARGHLGLVGQGGGVE